MSHRKIRALQIRTNLQIQKDSDKDFRNTFLPAINNENLLHNHHQAKNPLHFYQTAQFKKNPHALTSRNYENNENMDPEDRGRFDRQVKKTARPLVAIDKSLVKTVFDRKKIEAEVSHPQSIEENSPGIQTGRAKSIEISTMTNQFKALEATNEIVPLQQPKKKPSRVLMRDRTNSCRVATKRGLFPFSERQRQPLRIGEYFERQFQKLSTIGGESDHGSSKFISLDSFPELIS